MVGWSLGRPAFWWILLGAPIAAWLLPGRVSVPLLPLAISTSAWTIPGAFLVAWIPSAARRDLAAFLFGSRAGKAGFLVPELVFTAAAGAAVSLGFCAVWQASGHAVPWQMWTLVPFTALTASSLTLSVESRCPLSGRIILLMSFLLQTSDAPWVSSPIYQLALPPGYLMRSAEWATGQGLVIHGDIYLFFSVLEAAGLLLLSVKLASADPAASSGELDGSRSARSGKPS
jgi:hypothetical protein